MNSETSIFVLFIWNVDSVVDIAGSAKTGGLSATAAFLDISDIMQSYKMTNQALFYN